jgi:hypothetical protein
MKKIYLIALLFFIMIFISGCSTSSNNQQEPEDEIQVTTKTINKSWFENNFTASLNFPAGMIENKTYVTYTARFTTNTAAYDLNHASTTNITLTGYTKATYWGDFGTGYTKNISFTITLYKSNSYSNTNTIYLYRSDFPSGTIAISRVELYINSAIGTIVIK